MTNDDFSRRYGFARKGVTLANWRTRPYSTWSFQNVSEIVPSAEVSTVSEMEDQVDPREMLALRLTFRDGEESAAVFLERSNTDALTVMKRGAFVADYAAPTMDAQKLHLVFSIGKSLTAILAGTLQDEGKLDPAALVTAYIPEAKGSAYEDATVRDVLDMRVSLEFEEVYLDPESAFARYRRSTLWNPGFTGETLTQFVMSIRKGPAAHGGPFRYRSPNSDLLGMIVERASGRRFADLLRDRVLAKIGAKGRCSVTVDAEGTARTAGGVSITTRDLARIGEMMRKGGMGGSRPVVSEGWVRDTTTGGDKQAWTDGDFPHLAPNGSYRSKWYQTGFATGAFCAIGIHGQWLYVDPAHEVVIVKQSSQELPVDDPLDKECLAFFDQVAAAV